jgi:hypothetical protein
MTRVRTVSYPRRRFEGLAASQPALDGGVCHDPVGDAAHVSWSDTSQVRSAVERRVGRLDRAAPGLFSLAGRLARAEFLGRVSGVDDGGLGEELVEQYPESLIPQVQLPARDGAAGQEDVGA